MALTLVNRYEDLQFKLFSFPFPVFLPLSNLCLSVWLIVSVSQYPPLDEVYAQKLKGKALSEELDLALNDMTTL